MNVRAAFIHVLGDFLQSVGVFLAALLIWFKVSLTGARIALTLNNVFPGLHYLMPCLLGKRPRYLIGPRNWAGYNQNPPTSCFYLRLALKWIPQVRWSSSRKIHEIVLQPQVVNIRRRKIGGNRASKAWTTIINI